MFYFHPLCLYELAGVFVSLRIMSFGWCPDRSYEQRANYRSNSINSHIQLASIRINNRTDLMDFAAVKVRIRQIGADL